MKRILIMALFIFFTLNINAENNFRNIKWGMTKEDVKKIEKLEGVQEKKNELSYHVSIDGVNLILYYLFTDNKLYSAGYITAEAFPDGKKYLEIYNNFKSILLEKYGECSDEINTVPNTFEEELGLGLLLGKVEYSIEWDLEDIIIVLNVAGSNFTARVMLGYKHKRYSNQDRESIKRYF